ncbi:acyl-CoA synthetase [Streptomyces sp. bgisy031]|uniref:acyl-CoA synthetase n=1 Tax=Streptomyces sp. bgisy031 TaxID=3413772 RepID=UPI003D706BD4
MQLTMSLHRALRAHPERVATVSGARTRTVAEVADRVARLAGGLKTLGVQEGDRVAVLSANSDRYHEAYFASWWAGAPVNAVNTRWSAAEIAFCLSDSDSAILLVDDDHLPLVPELRARCPELHSVIHCGEGSAPADLIGYEELIASSPAVSDARRGGRDLAALLYTGGTTGTPKGVMLSHQSMMTSQLGAQVAHGAALRGGTTLVSAPLFHIAALGSWNTQNLVGGTQVFLPSFDADAVLAAIERHRINTLLLVPTMLQLLVERAESASYDLGSVHGVGYGGSPISATLLERVMKTFPNSGFYQGYGMTETAMVCVLGPEDHRAGGDRLRSAGQVVPHAEAAVVGPDGAELPPGRVGEVVVRGANVMLGYWRRSAESAEALRDGWLHTGDAGRMDENGYVYIVDRIKDMIVTGGENVYSVEVENAVARHPAVAGCAVVGLPDDRWGERVHAVVVLRPSAEATADEIRAHTKNLIAGYKAPRSVEFTEALPVSAAGKVLKSELRDRAVGRHRL